MSAAAVVVVVVMAVLAVMTNVLLPSLPQHLKRLFAVATYSLTATSFK
jgi:hypothetical protein